MYRQKFNALLGSGSGSRYNGNYSLICGYLFKVVFVASTCARANTFSAHFACFLQLIPAYK